jgi:phage protein D
MGTSAHPASITGRPVVTVDGQLVSEINEQIVSFEMTEKEGGLSTLELRLEEVATVDNRGQALLFETRNLIKLGSEVVAAGLDHGNAVELFRGAVTALEIEIQSGSSPTLVVLAEDAFQRARMARRTKLHENVTISDLVGDLAQQIGLTPSVTGLSDNIGTQLQLNESDLAFVRRLLARYDGDLKALRTQLRAAPRTQSDEAPIVLRTPEELERIRVIADLADQATKVTIAGWDVAQGQAVTATSQGANFGPGRGQKGADVLHDAIGDRSEHLSYLAVSNATEAQAVVDTAFDARARRFVVADGTVQAGDPNVRLGATVTLQGLGARFDNDYQVTLSRHRWDKTVGYKTDFTAESAFFGATP